MDADNQEAPTPSVTQPTTQRPAPEFLPADTQTIGPARSVHICTACHKNDNSLEWLKLGVDIVTLLVVIYIVIKAVEVSKKLM